jgi:hypothetical protein
MILRGLVLALSFLVLLVGCKKATNTLTGCENGASSSCSTLNKAETSIGVFGSWRSRGATHNGPVSYYQKLYIAKDRLRFSQVCAKRGSAPVEATVDVRAIISDSRITVIGGTEREEASDEIVCRVRVFPSEWRYIRNGNVLTLELEGSEKHQAFQFIPES